MSAPGMQLGSAPADVLSDPFLTHNAPARMKFIPPHAVPSRAEAAGSGPVSALSVEDAHVPLGAKAGGNLVGLDNDPFLTHSAGVRRSTTPVATGAAGAQLPKKPADYTNELAEDPFLTAPFHGPSPEMQAKARQVNWKMLLGQPYEDRQLATLRVMVFLPWLMFVWVLLLWVLMRHYSYQVTMGITLSLIVFCVGFVVAWLSGHVHRKLPIAVVALLCLAGAVLGALGGALGWQQMWRQYWWMQTGARYAGVQAETPAVSRMDAAVLGFSSNASSPAVVDVSRSAGYVSGHIYCVAPVLGPTTSAAGLLRVNYWAVGIDCCQGYGSFMCDDSRSHLGSYGVVMLDAGLPCPGCNADLFSRAVAKAEEAHGLVSARGALLVRWVSNPDTTQFQLGRQASLFVLLLAVLAFPPFYAAAWVLWYKGVGLQKFDATRPLWHGAGGLLPWYGAGGLLRGSAKV